MNQWEERGGKGQRKGRDNDHGVKGKREGAKSRGKGGRNKVYWPTGAETRVMGNGARGIK